MAKPDNRADNVEHLQQSIQNTQENLEEAEGYLNARRQQSIRSFQEEVKDEAAHSEE
jgi:small acid-soluble spore protein (thioredoxin-like protein)